MPGLEDGGDEGSPKLHTDLHLNFINKGVYLLMAKIVFPAPKQFQTSLSLVHLTAHPDLLSVALLVWVAPLIPLLKHSK